MPVAAGLIAAGFGPVIGGLFLAFPAIFPASATLVEKHVRERKEKAGLAGARRGKEAAALDAAGATLGSFGLAAFGLVIWLMVVPSPTGPSWSLRPHGSLSPCSHSGDGDRYNATRGAFWGMPGAFQNGRLRPAPSFRIKRTTSARIFAASSSVWLWASLMTIFAAFSRSAAVRK